MDKAAREEVVVSAYSPYLKRTITLTNEIWIYKILASHGEVRNCRQFIHETIEKLDKTSLIYKKKRNHSSIAVWKKCHYLEGMFEYLKIAIHLEGQDKGEIATAHGINNLPTHDMEPL